MYGNKNTWGRNGDDSPVGIESMVSSSQYPLNAAVEMEMTARLGLKVIFLLASASRIAVEMEMTARLGLKGV